MIPSCFFPGRHCDGIIALLGSGLQNGKHRSFATSQSEDLREDIKSLAWPLMSFTWRKVGLLASFNIFNLFGSRLGLRAWQTQWCRLPKALALTSEKFKKWLHNFHSIPSQITATSVWHGLKLSWVLARLCGYAPDAFHQSIPGGWVLPTLYTGWLCTWGRKMKYTKAHIGNLSEPASWLCRDKAPSLQTPQTCNLQNFCWTSSQAPRQNQERYDSGLGTFQEITRKSQDNTFFRFCQIATVLRRIHLPPGRVLIGETELDLLKI